MNWYFTVLQKYAQFNGRARRKEYWMFVLFNVIISYALGFIGGLLDFVFLSLIYTVIVLIPSLAVAVRRLHDMGRSGWFILIPIVNIIFLATPGVVGPNEYGDDPKGNTIFGAEDYEKPFDINA